MPIVLLLFPHPEMAFLVLEVVGQLLFLRPWDHFPLRPQPLFAILRRLHQCCCKDQMPLSHLAQFLVLETVLAH
jgi:hypothetical protein